MDKKNLGFTKQQLQYLDEVERLYNRRISECVEALERGLEYQRACDTMVEMGIISSKGLDMILASVSYHIDTDSVMNL